METNENQKRDVGNPLEHLQKHNVLCFLLVWGDINCPLLSLVIASVGHPGISMAFLLLFPKQPKHLLTAYVQPLNGSGKWHS